MNIAAVECPNCDHATQVWESVYLLSPGIRMECKCGYVVQIDEAASIGWLGPVLPPLLHCGERNGMFGRME